MESWCWFNGLATLLVGGYAIKVAKDAIKSNRENAEASKEASRKLTKQQVTTDVILQMQENQKILDKLAIIKKFHDENANGLAELAKKKLTEEERNSAQTIIETLSFFETIAAGVRHDIYDLQIVKDNMASAVKHLWKISECYVDRIRKDDENLRYYEHLEWLKDKM